MIENMYTSQNNISFDGAYFHGPATESRVHDAEDALQIKFPPSYRNFLLHIGAIHDIAGLPDPPPSGEMSYWLDVVELTNSMLTDLHGERHDRHLLYLSSDGGDLCYYLDSSRVDQDGEYPVVILGPGYDSVILAKNFFEFVKLSYDKNSMKIK